VALARAIVKSPKILLADEPTGSLDTETGLQVAALIRRLATEHAMAAIIATHDPRLVTFGNRTIEMQDGQIVADHRITPCE
jgi:putative ABC transport system ATP-binding protein